MFTPAMTADDVRELRSLLGRARGLGRPITQEELAVLVPCSKSAVAFWEQSKKAPSGLYRHRLAQLRAEADSALKVVA